MGKSGKSESNRRFWKRKRCNDSTQGQNQDLLEKPGQNGNIPEIREPSGAGQGGGVWEFTPPDGGWGWVVCLTSLWANGTVFGIINTFGIVYVQMREHYSKDDPGVSLKTAFVGSTCTGVTFLMCTVSSILSDRMGIRFTAITGAILATAGLVISAFIQKLELLYLTYGLILGIGSSMVYSPSLVILGHYFKRHMGLVNGIVSFGSSVFTIALTRILPLLLSTIDIKYCFLFLAGLHAMLVLFALSWKPLFRKEDHLPAMALSTESVYQHCGNCCTWTRKFLNVKIWRNRAYVTWIVSLCIALFGYFVPFFHLPKYTSDTFPGEDGSLLILCLSITSGVSRIICGKIADVPWVSRIRMQQVAFAVLGISTMCIPLSKSFEGVIAIALVMGVCDGVFVCLLGPVAFDIVGPGEASQAIGFLLGIFSIPFTIGPPVAGYMYDTLGDYRVAFHVAGAPPILGALCMFFIPKIEQSFPAVTETMEFASISMMDVYNEVKVPRERRTEYTGNGAPSGPLAELQVITSQELLHLGGHTKTAMDPEIGNCAEDTPILSAECEFDNQNDHCSTEMSTKADNMPKYENDAENENEVKVENEPKEGLIDESKNNANVNINNRKSGDMTHVNGVDSEDGEVEEDNVNHIDSKEQNGVLEPVVEYGVESSLLLNEVGKYLDAKKVSFNDNDKTSV